MADDLTIPAFLLFTAEQRKAAWEANPPKPASYNKKWKTPDHIVEARKARKKLSKLRRRIRTENKIAMAKDKQELRSGKIWDANIAKWVDPQKRKTRRRNGKGKRRDR